MSRRVVHRVPLGPMQDWCARVLAEHQGSIQAAARACGVDWHTFRSYLRGAVRHRHRRGADVMAIDRMLAAEGSTALEELYPIDEYPPPAERIGAAA